MRKTAIAILTSAISLSVMAQGQAQQSAPTPQPAMPAEASTPGVNPFTAKPLSAEALERRLALSKLNTSLLEEQLRQVALSEDIASLPARKQAEASTSQTQMARERVTQAGLAAELKALTAPPPAKVEPGVRARNGSKVTKQVEEPKPVVQPQPAKPVVNVISVSEIAGRRSAMLDISGDVISVEDGQTTPFGVVSIGPAGVTLNGQSMSVNDSTIGRVRRSDLDKPAPNPTAVVRNTLSSPAEPQGSNVPVVSQLPPLVLPPAVPNGQPVSTNSQVRTSTGR